MNHFYQAIHGKDEISIIAEIKKASPSHGPFGRHADFDLIRAYEEGGASAISVVTEKPRFRGSMDLLRSVVQATHLPVIRKDFLTQTEDLDETAQAGAAAVLLIAHLLSAPELQTLIHHALKSGLTPLVELHDHVDISKIRSLGQIPGVLLGINNRNLQTFQTDVDHALHLLEDLDPFYPVVAESAFAEASQMKPYQGKIDAALIGTAFLTAENPLEKVLTFINFTQNS
jgi:indole-3-glycerol phosphate synthase